ncbi:MAG: hypothetical protein EBY38_08630, partial [Flavobacteriaceae bacterium]|nr:hypothetical protein [Flavobacteriaceae bacterium]
YKAGAKLKIYDPMVSAEAMAMDIQAHWPKGLKAQVNTDRIVVVQDPKQSLQTADALAILTEWEVFKSYSFKGKPIFDGRNLLDKQTDINLLGK